MRIMRSIKMFGKVNDVKTRQTSDKTGYYVANPRNAKTRAKTK